MCRWETLGDLVEFISSVSEETNEPRSLFHVFSRKFDENKSFVQINERKILCCFLFLSFVCVEDFRCVDSDLKAEMRI